MKGLLLEFVSQAWVTVEFFSPPHDESCESHVREVVQACCSLVIVCFAVKARSALNLHVFMCSAAWALPLLAAWVTAPPYRQEHPCEPLVGMGTHHCMTFAAQVSTPERENFDTNTRRLNRETVTMHGIGLNAEKNEHLEASTHGRGPQHDYDEDRPDRRENEARHTPYGLNQFYHSEQDPAQREEDYEGVGIRDYQGDPSEREDKHMAPEVQQDVTVFMQSQTTSMGWFATAKKGLSVLLARGHGRQAALQLRDQLRLNTDPGLHRVIQAHLPGILEAEAVEDESVCLTSDEWIRHVLTNLSRVAGQDDQSRQQLLGPYAEDAIAPMLLPASSSSVNTLELPFGIFHAGQVWSNGTWSSRADLGMVGPQGSQTRGSAATSAPDMEEMEDDVSSLFQTEEEAARWDSLLEQFWEWFSEGRAVDLALGMLRHRAMDRQDSNYHQWVRGPLNTLGAGIEPNEQSSSETTPRDFCRWARRIEQILYSNYVRERVPAPSDETSLMDRYRNGRRRIRDSRTPRREVRRTTCVTTETRRLTGRRPGASTGSGGHRMEADRPQRREPGEGAVTGRGGERASGSTDVPRRATSHAGTTGPDLPDPQQPFTMEQSLQMWKYLLFDRWVFSTPREGGRIPTSWLPRDTLHEVNVHLGGMSDHNLLMMTTGLVTMIRYLMLELSQSLDMAQVVLNTRNGEPAIDIDEEDEEGDDTGLMQSFFTSAGQDTPERRWSRALMRLHKELEGQPKAIRLASVAQLRSALPPVFQSVPQTSWQVQLQALLVAISADCGEVQGTAIAPAQWLSTWALELATFIPGFGVHQCPQWVETQLNVSIDELLKDEEEAQAFQASLERQQDDEEAHRESCEQLENQELMHLAEEAKDYRAWEQAQTAAALRRPETSEPASKRCCVLSVEIASGSGDHPRRRFQTLGYDLPMDGSPLVLTFRAQEEANPSEVPTQIVAEEQPVEVMVGGTTPEQVAEANVEASGVPMHSLQVQRPTQADLLGLMDFAEYEAIYDRWRKGDLTQQDIHEQFGADVVEMVLAQEAVRDALDGEDSEQEPPTEGASLVSAASQLQPEMEVQCRVPYGKFELVYRDWKEAWLSDGEVLERHGPLWLSLFQQWRTWGLEAIWHLLEKVLETQPVEPGSKAATATKPPEPVSWPLRVPLFVVQNLLDKWVQGTVTSEQVETEYGHIWLRLLRKMQQIPYEKLRLGWSALVDWDQARDVDHGRSDSNPGASACSATAPRRGMVLGADGIWRRYTLEQFEVIFQQWATGQITGDDVHHTYGVDWLAVFLQRQEWGPESVWDYLFRIIDTLPDSAAATRPINAHLLPPEELVLPLRVPWSSVKERLRQWREGVVKDAEVQGRHGTKWLSLFYRIKEAGVKHCWQALDMMVAWDVPVDDEGVYQEQSGKQKAEQHEGSNQKGGK